MKIHVEINNEFMAVIENSVGDKIDEILINRDGYLYITTKNGRLMKVTVQDGVVSVGFLKWVKEPPEEFLHPDPAEEGDE